eukprot:IDg23548t1
MHLRFHGSTANKVAAQPTPRTRSESRRNHSAPYRQLISDKGGHEQRANSPQQIHRHPLSSSPRHCSTQNRRA